MNEIDCTPGEALGFRERFDAVHVAMIIYRPEIQEYDGKLVS